MGDIRIRAYAVGVIFHTDLLRFSLEYRLAILDINSNVGDLVRLLSVVVPAAGGTFRVNLDFFSTCEFHWLFQGA